MAALVLLVCGPAPVAATVGAALTVLGNVCFTSVFAAAAYAQPAIGRAYLAGRPGAEDLYDDVYGTPLLVVFGVGALLFVAGAVVLGRAVARTAPGSGGPRLRRVPRALPGLRPHRLVVQPVASVPPRRSLGP